MARTGAERQRDFRARQQARQDEALAELEAGYEARLKKYAGFAQARITALEEELAAASGAEAVCGCGEQLRCPACYTA